MPPYFITIFTNLLLSSTELQVTSSHLFKPLAARSSLLVKNLPAMQEIWV